MRHRYAALFCGGGCLLAVLVDDTLKGICKTVQRRLDTAKELGDKGFLRGDIGKSHNSLLVDHATRKRIKELLDEKKTNISELCLKGGLTPSTLYDFMRETTGHVQLNTIKQICMGFDIRLSDFFDKPYFDDYE